MRRSPSGVSTTQWRPWLLTTKPVLYVCNVAEADAATGNALSEQVIARAHEEGAGSVVVSAAIEAEVAQLTDPEEKREFLEALGLEETGLNRVIRAGYELLHLITFFTVGPKEARAWTIVKGTKAPGAAGVIQAEDRGHLVGDGVARGAHRAFT